MKKTTLNSKHVVLTLFLLIVFLSTDLFSQPPSSAQGGRRFGQNEHFNPPGPPPQVPLTPPPSPQYEFLRPTPVPDIDIPAREVLEQIFVARIASRLKLTDDQTILFLKKFVEFQEHSKQLLEERKRIADTLRATIGKKSDEINREELAKIYNDLLEIDKKIFERKKNFVDEIGANLELEKKAELYLILSDFEEEIKKFLRKAYEWKQRRGKSDKFSPEMATPQQQSTE